jgi:hypothetical protein
LKKGNLADEKMARRRAYNTHEKMSNNDSDDMKHQTSTVIILPRIVRDFSEGKITEETNDFFLQILSGWYYDQLHQIFVKNENVIFSAYQKESNEVNFVKADCEKLEENIDFFIKQMHEKYQEEKYKDRSGN